MDPHPNWSRVLVIHSVKPKVLHVYKTALPLTYGGVEEVIAQIIDTTKDDFDHTILCTNPARFQELDLISHKVISHKANLTFSNNPVSIGFHSFLYKFSDNYDLIHFHFPYPMMDLHHTIEIPYIITYHSDLLRSQFITKPYSFLAKKFLQKAKAVVFTSENYVNYSKFSKYSKQIKIIPLTVSQQAEAHLSKINPIGDYFIFIGAFRAYKNLEGLLKSAIRTNAKLKIVGSGRRAEKYKQSVKNNNKEKIIEFFDNVSDKIKFDLLANSRALILPSIQESEAFGVVLLEAAVFAKPIVTANIPTGVTSVNINGVTGATFDRKQERSLDEVLLQFKQDQLLCERLGKKNRERYIQNFTRKSFAQAYKSTYSECLF